MALTVVDFERSPMVKLDLQAQTAVVHTHLEDEVLRGIQPPGTTLVAAALAEAHGVSPAAVRRALVRLERSGLMARQGDEYVVTGVRLREVRSFFEVRSSLEPVAAMLAARRIDTVHGARLRQLASTDYANATAGALIERDRQLAISMCEAAENEELASLVLDLLQRNERLLYLAYRTPTVVDYSDLVDAILDGREDDARRSACEHISNARRRVVDALLSLR